MRSIARLRSTDVRLRWKTASITSLSWNVLINWGGVVRSDIRQQQVVDYSVVRIAQGVTHFSPGSYDSMPTCETPIPNMFMSGDWVVNEHGSFSQGKTHHRFAGAAAAKRVACLPHFAIESNRRHENKCRQTRCLSLGFPAVINRAAADVLSSHLSPTRSVCLRRAVNFQHLRCTRTSVGKLPPLSCTRKYWTPES